MVPDLVPDLIIWLAPIWLEALQVFEHICVDLRPLHIFVWVVPWPLQLPREGWALPHGGALFLEPYGIQLNCHLCNLILGRSPVCVWPLHSWPHCDPPFGTASLLGKMDISVVELVTCPVTGSTRTPRDSPWLGFEGWVQQFKSKMKHAFQERNFKTMDSLMVQLFQMICQEQAWNRKRYQVLMN